MVNRWPLLVLSVFLLVIGTAGPNALSSPEIYSILGDADTADGRGIENNVPQKLAPLEGVQTPFTMAVDGNDLFVADGNHVVRVYSIEPFALRFTFGGKGEGPRELQYRPQLWTRPDVVVASDFLKSLWFSRNGKFIKAVNYSKISEFDTGQEMQLFPIGSRYIRNIVDHRSRKRTITLLDANLNRLELLHEGLFDWNQVGGTRKFNLLTHRIEVTAGDGEIFISDTEKGFFIRIFDLDGNVIGTIDLNKNENPIPVSASGREKLLEEVRTTRPENVYRYAKANAAFPETFPRMHHIRYSDGRLYVTTHRMKDGLHEMLVLDARGKILNRLFLPLKSFHHFRGPFRSDFFDVSGGSLYELIQNPETQSWELWKTDLSGSEENAIPRTSR